MLKTSRITMKELSELSGYSVSTVSKALNGKQDISPDATEYIKSLAKKFNYVPNKFALALRGIKTKSIAVVIPEVTLNHYSKMLYHLQEIAEIKGYRVILFQTFHNEKKQYKCINSLNDGSIDGVFLISDTPKENSNLRLKNTPLIQLGVNQFNTDKEIKELSSSGFSKFLKLDC